MNNCKKIGNAHLTFVMAAGRSTGARPRKNSSKPSADDECRALSTSQKGTLRHTAPSELHRADFPRFPLTLHPVLLAAVSGLILEFANVRKLGSNSQRKSQSHS